MSTLSRIPTFLVLFLLVAVGLLAAGCGDDSSDGSSTSSSSKTTSSEATDDEPTAEETEYATQLAAVNDDLRAASEAFAASTDVQGEIAASKLLVAAYEKFTLIEAPESVVNENAQLKAALRRSTVPAKSITPDSTVAGNEVALKVINRELTDADERISDLLDQFGYEDA